MIVANNFDAPSREEVENFCIPRDHWQFPPPQSGASGAVRSYNTATKNTPRRRVLESQLYGTFRGKEGGRGEQRTNLTLTVVGGGGRRRRRREVERPGVQGHIMQSRVQRGGRPPALL